MTTFIKSHLISQSSSGIFHYNFEVISPLYLKLGLDSEKHINPKSLQYIMGHSDINITMNPYAHVSVDSVKSEVVKYFIYIFEVAHGSQEPDLTGVQVVSRPHRDQVSRRHDRDRRSERLRQIEYLGRDPLGARRAVLALAARGKDGGRHFQRHGEARPGRLCRGLAHPRQLRRYFPLAVCRNHGDAPLLPFGRERILPRQKALPSQGYPRAVHGHRPRPRRLFQHRTGADR